MARWKISNSFIEEVAIKMLSTATYIQNKNNPAYTALYVKKKRKNQGWLFSFEINATILFLKSFAFEKKINIDLLANLKCHESWTSLTLFKSTSWNY